MNRNTKTKEEINLFNSINADTLEYNTFIFGDQAAPLNKNTGIEREGGITNQYEKKDTLPSGKNIITESGDVLNFNNGAVTLSGKPVALVSPYGIETDTKLSGYDDACLSSDGKILAINVSTSGLTLYELSMVGAVVRQRTTAFTALTTAYSFYTSLSFVRYNGIKYDDVLEYCLRLSDAVIILNEATPGQAIETSILSSSVLGANAVRAMVVYNSFLIVAGDGGRIGSFDGSAWKNYDGSGAGIGPSNNGAVIGANNIYCLTVYNNSLVVSGAGGRVGSFDGTAWHLYTDAGTGLWNNSTVVSTDDIRAACVVGSALAFGGSVGKLGSWDGSAWRLYSDTTGNYLTDNATIIGAVAINAMCVYGDKLAIAGASGRVGSMDLSHKGITWIQRTLPASVNWISVTYGNGVFVAVASNSSIAATSTDGITWTQRTMPASILWTTVAYGNGVFVAVAQSTSIAATSPDGITWTQRAMPVSGEWRPLTYGNGVFVAGIYASSISATSPDGITWTQRTLPVSANWASATFGNNVFVIVAGLGTSSLIAATSPDGITWTQRAMPVSAEWRSVTYGGSSFVAVASTSAIAATSPDGITWTQRTLPVSTAWGSVTYGNGVFVAVAGIVTDTSIAATSPDGITWTQRAMPVSTKWFSTTFGNGTFVSVAYLLTTIAAADVIPKYLYTLGSGLTNNGTVIGANAINCMATYQTRLALAGVGGRVGSWDGSAWTLYTSGTGLADNGTIIGTNDILALNVYSTYLAIGGVGGRLGSFNADYSKNLYTGTTGIRSNGSAVGANNINSMVNYGTGMMLGAATSIVGNMKSDLSFSSFWTDGSVPLVNLLTGFSSFNYLYCYRYENGRYLLNLVGNTNNVSYSIVYSAKTYVSLKARYAIPQVSGGFTRHILTGDPVYTAAKIESIGLHGYTDFIAYSDTEVFPAAAVSSISSVPSKNIGFGCVDHTYTVGTGTYNFAPLYRAATSSLYQIVQSNTNTLVNAYGKVTNNYNLSPSVPFEFRIIWINGTQSALSVARISGAQDNLGVLITAVGEFDETYTPQTINDNTILFRYNNQFYIKVIGTAPEERLAQIDQYIYKINTISPYNIVDTKNGTISIGSSDYNGRMLFPNTATASAVYSKVVTLSERKYSSSIDVGDKLVTVPTPSSASIEVIGYRIADAGKFSERYTLDTYINDVYSFSTAADGTELVDPAKSGTLYIGNTLLPVPIGSTYAAKTARTKNTTLLLDSLFDGYQIGNEIEGEYTIFSLFGQPYAFDGRFIYLLSAVNGVFSKLVTVCEAAGLYFVASSPTVIYFLSSFDNSLYTFDGGRTVNKTKRMNQLPNFVKGAYSTFENSLLIETDTSFVWLRDGVLTQNMKDIDQTSLKLYPTSKGLVIANDSTSWQYNFIDGSGYTVMPFEIRTAFFGLGKNEKSILEEYVFTIFNRDKEKMSILGTIYVQDESDNFDTQDFRWDIDAPDYSTEGYCKLRIKPEIYRPMATSIGLVFDKKAVLFELIAMFGDASDGVISASKTR